MQFSFGSISVQIQCICETALTHIILDVFISPFVNSISQDLNCTGFWSHRHVNALFYKNARNLDSLGIFTLSIIMTIILIV